MSTFTFEKVGYRLRVIKRFNKAIRPPLPSYHRMGCGNTIIWSDMPIVSIPDEFKVTSEANTSDLENLPERAKRNWSQLYNNAFKSIKLTPLKK